MRTKRTLIGLAVVVASFGAGTTGLALADASHDAPVTPATQWHGLPANNPGFSDEAHGACPATAGDQCDGGIHGIANNPGQSGVSPADQGVPACNMHGGFVGVKRQCPEGIVPPM